MSNSTASLVSGMGTIFVESSTPKVWQQTGSQSHSLKKGALKIQIDSFLTFVYEAISKPYHLIIFRIVPPVREKRFSECSFPNGTVTWKKGVP